jgi:hypothetical protein
MMALYAIFGFVFMDGFAINFQGTTLSKRAVFQFQRDRYFKFEA